MRFGDMRAKVQGRLWIIDCDLCDSSFWSHELDPTDLMRRPTSEWAMEHFGIYGDEELRTMFDLPPEGDFQVLFTGYIVASRSYDGEWDEEFEVESSEFAPVPENHFRSMGDNNEGPTCEQTMSIDDIKESLFNHEYGLVKYVRLVGGEYRFCHSDANHKDQVQKGEQADAAGFLAYSTDEDGIFFQINHEWSMTLIKGPDHDVDGPAIASLLGFRYKGEE